VVAVPITDARDDFAELINRAAYGGERIVLTRRGKALAAIISAEDLDFFQELEDLNDVRAAQAALAEDPVGIPFEEVRAEHAR